MTEPKGYFCELSPDFGVMVYQTKDELRLHWCESPPEGELYPKELEALMGAIQAVLTGRALTRGVNVWSIGPEFLASTEDSHAV
jgi:hypothetical protein